MNIKLESDSYLTDTNFLVEELTLLIQSNPHPRELKRALAVKMVLQDYTYFEIRDVLQVSIGFISKWKQMFEQQGVRELLLKYRGTTGYLDLKQRQAVIDWLQQKKQWKLLDLQQHIEDSYNVVFASHQSYYNLFQVAGISRRQQKNKSYSSVTLVKEAQEIAG